MVSAILSKYAILWFATLFILLLPAADSQTDDRPTPNCANINLSPEENRMIPFDSNETLVYTCVVEGNQISWAIEGTNLDCQIHLDGNNNHDNNIHHCATHHRIAIERESSQLSESRLTVNQSARHSLWRKHGYRIKVGCFPIIHQCLDYPKRSITYGFPEPPFRLSFSALAENRFNLSWTTTVVPLDIEIEYVVQVRNSTGNVVFNNSTRNTSITIDNLVTIEDNSSLFNFTVQAFSINGTVGNSSVVYTLQSIPIAVNVSSISKSVDTEVNITRNEDVFITISFNPATVYNENFPVENYTVVLENGTTIPVDVSNVSGKLQAVITGLSMDRAIYYFITACTNVSCSPRVGPFTAYVTGIQRPSVNFTEASKDVLLMCEFPSGSKAKGCRFDFAVSSDNKATPESYKVFKDDKEVLKGDKENSTLFQCGDSQACKCVTTKHNVSNYSTIEAYAIEDDVIVNISVPARKLDSNKLSSVCNPSSVVGFNWALVIGLITCTGILVLLVTIILRIIAGGVLYKRKQKKPDSPDSEKGQHESQSQSAKVETDGDILEHKLESTLQSDSGDVSDTDETVPAATPGSRYVPVEKGVPDNEVQTQHEDEKEFSPKTEDKSGGATNKETTVRRRIGEAVKKNEAKETAV